MEVLIWLCIFHLATNFKGFFDILNDIDGISNRMLSKELKGLGINQPVKRTLWTRNILLFNMNSGKMAEPRKQSLIILKNGEWRIEK